ncbi:MAG: FAD-dependent monooxygenase [Alcanivorax sp.]
MVKMKKSICDIVIVGGGIAGLTLTKLLSDQGVNIHLIEPRPPAALNDTSTTGRTVALMQTSLNILKAAGQEDFCKKHGTKMEAMRLYDDSISGQDPIISEFEAFDIGLPYFSMNIPNNPLRAKLYEDIKASQNVTIHENRKLRDITQNAASGIKATLDNDETIEAQLIVGSDGRESLVRKLAHIKTTRKMYGQTAITLVINHSKSHQNISTEFHRPGGPFAIVPMKGNQSSIVWVENSDKADELLKLPKKAFESTLQDATKGLLGAINMETTPEGWPLCSIKAKSLTAERIALIAEAAHVMSPITAQGLNLSLRDVATLAETVIDTLRVGEDIGKQATLKTYESRRRADIGTRTFGVDTLNNLVRTDRAPIKDIRRIGLKMVDKFSPLKMLAMQHGLAPKLDQGRLASGEPL